MQEKLFEEFLLTDKDSLVVKNLFGRRKMDKMWAYIDSLKINLTKLKEMEVICKHNGVVIRGWKH